MEIISKIHVCVVYPAGIICIGDSILLWYDQGWHWINIGPPICVAIDRKYENVWDKELSMWATWNHSVPQNCKYNGTEWSGFSISGHKWYPPQNKYNEGVGETMGKEMWQNCVQQLIIFFYLVGIRYEASWFTVYWRGKDSKWTIYCWDTLSVYLQWEGIDQSSNETWKNDNVMMTAILGLIQSGDILSLRACPSLLVHHAFENMAPGWYGGKCISREDRVLCSAAWDNRVLILRMWWDWLT